MGPKEQHGGEFFGFSFSLFDPGFGDKEVGNPEIPIDTRKSPPDPPKPALLSQRIMEGTASNTENFDSNQTLLAQRGAWT